MSDTPMTKDRLAAIDSRINQVLAAEGDSWFDFPFKVDVLYHLKRMGYSLMEAADAGHTLREIANAPSQRADFRERMERLAKRNTPPEAVLLSAGGNDFVDWLEVLLNQFSPNAPVLNDFEVNRFLERLKSDYLAWIQFATGVCQDLFDSTIPILVHGYAYVVPDGRGTLWGIAGPWLERKFHGKGHESLNNNIATLEILVDKLNDALSIIAGNAKTGHVRHVDLRPILSNDPSDYKDDWRDELHPTDSGFRKVAEEFVQAL